MSLSTHILERLDDDLGRARTSRGAAVAGELSEVLDKDLAERVVLEAESAVVGEDGCAVLNIEHTDAQRDQVAPDGGDEPVLGRERGLVRSSDA